MRCRGEPASEEEMIQIWVEMGVRHSVVHICSLHTRVTYKGASCCKYRTSRKKQGWQSFVPGCSLLLLHALAVVVPHVPHAVPGGAWCE